eukprot:TRINITY_DN7169_c0_g1_i1.p1 TRINITY_DN7169_c0_g1~~TRINITY_DN7169_c0_g1_i1.p1  ORF type:complete len:448 (+),score=35.52 TRINITY_DN7169_c0_g1_i1:122-1465(+)
MLTTTLSVLALFLLFYIPSADASLRLTTQKNESVFECASYFFHYDYQINADQRWPLVGPIVYLPSNLSNLNASLSFTGQTSVRGKIIITSDVAIPRVFWWWVQELEKSGASGVIVVDGKETSMGYLEMAALPMRTLKIQTFGISEEQYSLLRPILDGSDVVNASIWDRGEITAWRSWLWSPHVWVFSVALSVLAAVLFALTAFKLARQIRFHGVANIPAICLGLHSVTLLVLFVLWGADPLGRNQLFSSSLNEGARVVSVPFTCSAVILLIFHWWRLLKPTHLRFGFDIDRYRIVASIFIFLLFGLTGLSVLNRSVGVRLYSPVWAFNIALVLLSVPVLLFFLLSSLRVLYRISDAKRNVLSIESQLQNQIEDDPQYLSLLFCVALKIVGISLSLFGLTIVSFLMFSQPFLHYDPVWTFSMWSALHFSLVLLAFFSFLIFDPSPPTS